MDIFKRQSKTVRLYRKVFSTKEGQEVLKHLCNMCGLYSNSFCEDTHKTAFFEGKKFVILSILKAVRTTDTELDKLYTEHKKVKEEHYE